jgi:hypothetical protein
MGSDHGQICFTGPAIATIAISTGTITGMIIIGGMIGLGWE